jgi:hypothetical protein
LPGGLANCAATRTSRGAGRVDPPSVCGQGTGLKCRKQVVALQVRVVREDLIERHARGQQFQQRLDRLAEPADTGWPWQTSGSVVMRSSRDMRSAYGADDDLLVHRFSPDLEELWTSSSAYKIRLPSMPHHG